MAARAALREQDVGREFVRAVQPESKVLENLPNAREQMLVAPFIGRNNPRQQPQSCHVKAQLADRWPHQGADQHQVLAPFRLRQPPEAAQLAHMTPMMWIVLDYAGVGKTP